MPDLKPNAIEQSTYPITVTLTDSDGVAIIPNNDITWSLSDSRGHFINSHESTAYDGDPASVFTIVLKGDDLLMRTNEDKELRYLIVRCTYDSDVGSDLPLVAPATFWVDGLQAVTNG